MLVKTAFIAAYHQAREQQAILLQELQYDNDSRFHVAIRRAIRWEANMRKVAKHLGIRPLDIQYTGWLDYYATSKQLEVIQ